MLTTSALDDIRTDAADANASAATQARAPTFNARRGTYCCGRLEYGYEPWHLGPYHPDVYKAKGQRGRGRRKYSLEEGERR